MSAFKVGDKVRYKAGDETFYIKSIKSLWLTPKGRTKFIRYFGNDCEIIEAKEDKPLVIQLDLETFRKKYNRCAPLDSVLYEKLVTQLFNDTPDQTLEEAERRISDLERTVDRLERGRSYYGYIHRGI